MGHCVVYCVLCRLRINIASSFASEGVMGRYGDVCGDVTAYDTNITSFSSWSHVMSPEV